MPRGTANGTILGFTLSPMTDLWGSQSAVDHYEAALEASCATLIALQLVSAMPAGSPAEVAALKDQITRAITSQRRAIAELRLARSNAPVIGFVLPAGAKDGTRRGR